MKTEDVIDKHHRELQLIYEALLDDVSRHSDLLKSHPNSAVWRRSIVRTTFAFVEGTASSMQRFLVFLAMVRKDDLGSLEDAELLFDSYRITPAKGKKRKRMSFADSIKKTLNLLAEACRVEFDIGSHSKAWSNFLDVIQVRDRVTHPKEPKDLVISDAELIGVAEAAKWFIDAFTSIVNARQARVESEKKDNK